MQDMKNRQNTENLETTTWVYRCEAEVTKAIYQIINFNGSPEILLQYLVIYGIIILFFPGEAGVERLVLYMFLVSWFLNQICFLHVFFSEI